MEYLRDEHRVHLIIYQLVWTPKRRKPVLTGKVASRCKEIIENKCEEKGWEILELAIQPDHIHLFVRVWPSDAPADVIKEIKGVTSHNLRKEFPQLLKLPSMWTRAILAPQQGMYRVKPLRSTLRRKRGCDNAWQAYKTHKNHQAYTGVSFS